MNTLTLRALRLIPLPIAAAVAGCGTTSPAPMLLTLPHAAAVAAPSAPAPAVAGAPASKVMVLRRIEVPEYLAARRVRYRADASTLAEWPNTYWAERIEIGVSREFAAALRQQLPGWRLCEAHCSEQAPALATQVELTQMDFVRGEQRLLARAQLAVWSADRTPRLLRSQEQAYVIAGQAATPQAQAEAITELLRRVAADLAALAQGAAAPAAAPPR
ncbi:ABC-type transport auxiliary lipoprotein family protein [Aquincola sp. MAHUQ-54]|uniref:ABC-type transport auxiliary lipoprotein family protein n=1 Tax=Aquincola agrisoli TaxID=3119538 RepID=A0AAW9Q908_9BURK